MSQFYSDPKREDEPTALPDCEVFYRTREENEADGWLDGDEEVQEAGWYYWACFPGCLPDSDAFGPFLTEQDAILDARDYFGEE